MFKRLMAKARALVAARPAVVTPEQLAQEQAQRRAQAALVRQVQGATTVRQLLALQELALPLLPPELLQELHRAVRVRLVALPVLPTRTPGSPRNTGSSGKTAHSISKPRRAR